MEQEGICDQASGISSVCGISPPIVSQLVDDLLRGSLSLTEIAEVHALTIAQLLDLCDDPAIERLINRAEKLSLRRARAISALILPLALDTLAQSLRDSPDPESKRKAAAALTRAATALN